MNEIAISNKKKIAFLGMVVGMFMAILDVQIVASSLSVIGAGLSASVEELSWVQTSYMIAEAIIIPVTGFLARLLSTRISYFIAAAGFTVMSALCALAWNIQSMIVFRALQGFFGGAMIPTVFATIFTIFDKKQQGAVIIIIGLITTIAPTLGPTLGGYITEIFSWQYMFLLNIVPGIFVATSTFLYADFDKPNYGLLKNFDITGVCLLTITLACLEYLLEEGNKCGWFESNLIITLAIIVVGGSIWFIRNEITHTNPILHLSIFRNSNFTVGCIYAFILGVGLFGAIYLLPIFLYRIAGLNTVQIGLVMFVAGFFQFLSAPIIGKLFNAGVDRKAMLAFGFITFAASCYLNSFMTEETRFGELFLSQVLRGTSLMFCFIPINDIAMGYLSKEEIHNASGIYNLIRQIGGAFGLAIISTVLTNNTVVYKAYLSENITQFSGALLDITGFTGLLECKFLNMPGASHMLLDHMLYKNAFIITVNNIFYSLAIMFVLSLPLLFMTRNVAQSSEVIH